MGGERERGKMRRGSRGCVSVCAHELLYISNGKVSESKIKR